MRSARFLLAAIALASLASCEKPDSARKTSGDPCDSAKAQPPYLTQEQAVKACKDNRNFAGAPTKRSKIQISNH